MIENASSFGICRVVQLEAAIEAEAVDDVGAHPAAHPVGALENGDIDTVAGEMAGGGEAAQSGSHDHDGHGRYGSGPDAAPGLPSGTCPRSPS